MSTNTPNTKQHTQSISVEDVKRAASGRWLQILPAAGLPSELLDGRQHPCPKCGGTDRFTAFGDVDVTGGVMCRQCFSKENGDGLAAVQWLRGCTFPEALAFVAEFVGISPQTGTLPKPDIVQAVATAKRMPLESFLQFGAKPDRRGREEVVRVPVYNEHGDVHSHFDLTPQDKGYFKNGKGSSGLFFPRRLPKPGEKWLLVEGIKDAAVLVGLGYLVCGLNTNHMNAKYATLFRDCEIIVVPDLDEAGTRGAQQTASRLAGIASTVRVARLPGELLKTGGADVRDVIARNGADAVRTAIDNARPFEASEGEPDERPEVLVTFEEAAVTEQVLQHLGRLGWATPWLKLEDAERSLLYQRGGVLVHVVNDTSAKQSAIKLQESVPQIRALPKSLVRERITQAVRLIEEVKKGEEFVRVPKRPAEWLVQGIHQRGEYCGSVRPLAGVIRTPTLRADGSVLQVRGYDAATGLLYLPDRDFSKVPEKPTQEDAKRAADMLLDVVVDFPFATAADRAIWLAAVLTLLLRSAIAGPTPLFAFDANVRGAGKTWLADLAAIIAIGPALARVAWPGCDEEVRKLITSVALEGWSSVLLDNVATKLGGPSLDAALTATTWQGRILGESRTTGLLPLTTVWLATGNNIELSADTARRTLLARLESLEEHPEDRSQFKHADLKKFVRDERARLAVAGLTLLRAYFAAGCPDMGLAPWGSFEEWSRLIRHAIVWAGQADPRANCDAVRNADQSAQLVRLIHEGIEEADIECEGVTAADIARLLGHEIGQDGVDHWATLREAMSELCGPKLDSRKIGYGLRRYQGRVCAGKRLINSPGHGGVKRWMVEPVIKSAPAVGGDGGDGCDQNGPVRVATSQPKAQERVLYEV